MITKEGIELKTKQCIILRTDLNMRKGKMVAQGAHASMAVLTQFKHVTYEEYPEELKDWLDHSFTKICVGIGSEEELLEIYNQAKTDGILCSLITDNGATEFGGVKTITCAAIGPDYEEFINTYTGHLKLL